MNRLQINSDFDCRTIESMDMVIVVVGFSVLLVSLGFVNLLLAYGVLAGAGDEGKKQCLRRYHKILGYIFIVLFMGIFLVMTTRVITFGPFSFQAVLHDCLALFAVAALLLKLLIVKWYRKFSVHLFFVGSAIFVLSFVLVFLIAGKAVVQYMGNDGQGDGNGKVEKIDPRNPEWPKGLSPEEVTLVSRCGHCHDLGRVILKVKQSPSPAEWTKTVRRMKELKPGFISDQDEKTIVDYLSVF